MSTVLGVVLQGDGFIQRWTEEVDNEQTTCVTPLFEIARLV
jgi:hypothetical protein